MFPLAPAGRVDVGGPCTQGAIHLASGSVHSALRTQGVIRYAHFALG